MTRPIDTVELSPQQHAFDYETYDKAVARLCNALTIVDTDGLPTNRPIPLMFATPERAWARMRQKFNKELSEDRDFKIPLPFISVQQIGDTAFDPRRHLYRKILYRKVAIDTEDFGTCLSHPHPKPYTFQYSIELWVKTRYEARVNVAQWANIFSDGGMTYRKVDHGLPLGVKIVPFFEEGITDNTNLEPIDSQRSLRWTFTVRVDGWLSPPMIQQKLVHEIHTDIETPANLCEPDPYAADLVDGYYPLAKGNPETGEVVNGNEDFDEYYAGIDYRVKRFSQGNPCVET